MRFKKRKGISYILEVAMMTLVVVALATVVLTWGLGQVSSSRIALTGAVNDRINRLQEGINVEDVQMLTSGTMRVYIRNTGAIQDVIDSVYINNVNAPIQGVCPYGSFQSGQVSTSASGGYPITFGIPEPDGTYTVTLTPSWSGAPVPTSGSLLATGFTITLGSAKTGTVNWITNYATCPAGTRLSLAINAIGAVDVSVPSSVSSCAGGPVCAGNSYSVTAATNRGTTITASFTV